jgi:hypothetical protein
LSRIALPFIGIKVIEIQRKPKEDTVAKGQMRSNKEKKKPKADKNKKKGEAPTSPFASGHAPGKPGYAGKKNP